MSYEVVKDLGSGAFGTVELINHEKHGLVVRKINKIPKSNVYFSMLIVKNELNILKRLTDSGKCKWNIKMFEFEAKEIQLKKQKAYKVSIIMEYFSGFTLDLIEVDFQKDGMVKWKFMMGELIDAVRCLHEQNVAHRDLKLQNIMFDEKQLKLIDFGHSCHIPSNGFTCDQQVGTPYYMSPEAAKKYSLTPEELYASDIWAIGMVMFTLAYKRKLLQGLAGSINKVSDMYEKHITIDVFFPKKEELDKLMITEEQAKQINLTVMKFFERDVTERTNNFNKM
jgi:serine/threonine protein kinase